MIAELAKQVIFGAPIHGLYRRQGAFEDIIHDGESTPLPVPPGADWPNDGRCVGYPSDQSPGPVSRTPEQQALDQTLHHNWVNWAMMSSGNSVVAGRRLHVGSAFTRFLYRSPGGHYWMVDLSIFDPIDGTPENFDAPPALVQIQCRRFGVFGSSAPLPLHTITVSTPGSYGQTTPALTLQGSEQVTSIGWRVEDVADGGGRVAIGIMASTDVTGSFATGTGLTGTPVQEYVGFLEVLLTGGDETAPPTAALAVLYDRAATRGSFSDAFTLLGDGERYLGYVLTEDPPVTGPACGDRSIAMAAGTWSSEHPGAALLDTHTYPGDESHHASLTGRIIGVAYDAAGNPQPIEVDYQWDFDQTTIHSESAGGEMAWTQTWVWNANTQVCELDSTTIDSPQITWSTIYTTTITHSWSITLTLGAHSDTVSGSGSGSYTKIATGQADAGPAAKSYSTSGTQEGSGNSAWNVAGVYGGSDSVADQGGPLIPPEVVPKAQLLSAGFRFYDADAAPFDLVFQATRSYVAPGESDAESGPVVMFPSKAGNRAARISLYVPIRISANPPDYEYEQYFRAPFSPNVADAGITSLPQHAFTTERVTYHPIRQEFARGFFDVLCWI